MGDPMVPALRFKDEHGQDFPDWDEKKLEQISEVIGGGTPASEIEEFWEGEINWFTPTEIRSKYVSSSNRRITKLGLKKSSAKLLTKGSILFTSRATIGEVSFNLEEASTNQGFQNFTEIKANSEFLYQWLKRNKKIFLRKSQGSTFLEIGKSEIKKVKINLPTKPEQQKIADFLSSVDTKIEQLTRKKELLEKYKTGMMQKLFPKPGEQHPELRFKDEHGQDFPDWEETKLGDCLDYTQPTKYLVNNTDYDDTYETPVLTAGKTFVLGYTNEKEGIYCNLPAIIFDDFTTASKYVAIPFKAKSSAMKILNARHSMNIRFLYGCIENLKFEVGGHKRHWISIFSELLVFIPSNGEQKKIADFLSAIDDKITKLEGKLTKTQTFKKGLLQHMFV